LMLRMIASELAGRKLAAKEIISIEHGESPYGPPQPIPPEQQTGNPPVLPLPAEPVVASQFSFLPSSPAARWVLLLGILAIGKLAQEHIDRNRSEP
jgi:hypothetical protein